LHWVNTISFSYKLLEVSVTDIRKSIITPVRSPAVHDLECTAFNTVIITNNTHSMTTKTHHAVILVSGMPYLLPHHSLHKASAHHHTDHNRGILCKVFFYGTHI